MKKIFLSVLIIGILICGVFIVRKNTRTSITQTKKLSIVTTLFPLYDMVRHIGGNDVDVSLLLPPGVEAHSFEPKPSDIAKINNADIFIYTGKFMEPWVDGILKGLTNQKITIIDASAGIPMIVSSFHDSQGAPSGSPDPHIWLDFDNDVIIVDAIARALIAKDSLHARDYQVHRDTYVTALTALDAEYRQTLSTCQKKDVIFGGHFAFGYLAKRYGLQIRAAQGLSPDAEPTARDLIALVDQIKKNSIDVIYFEELTSPKIAETLAGETHTNMLLLNAGHNISKNDFENGTTFFAIMEENLKNLKIGLHCN